MKRLHLFEFEDMPWFPAWLRDYGTDFLRAIADRADYYEQLIPVLLDAFDRSRRSAFVDIAAGGGGGWEKILQRMIPLRPDMNVTLTDIFPNREAFAKLASRFPAHVTFCAYPVDALNVPSHLRGVRTQFMSFHHFRPRAAQRLLADAVVQRSPILVVEAQERNAFNLLKFLVLSPLCVWLLTPGIRPFRWKRIFFTYFIPLIPAYLLWDGLVSVCRTYTLNEMLDLAYGADLDRSYIWEVGKAKGGLMPVSYLLGYPVERPVSPSSGG